MEVKMFNPFDVKPKTKTKPKSLPKAKTKLEARGLTPENKKKLSIIYAKVFVNPSRK